MEGQGIKQHGTSKMKISPLNNAKKKKFLDNITDFGIKKIPQLLIRSGKESIRAYSGDLSTEEILDIWRLLPIEGIGLYIGKETINRHGIREVRLSLDGLHIWKDQINNKIITLTEKQEIEWFEGKILELKKEIEWKNSFVAIKSHNGEDFIGMGKTDSDGKKIHNYLPKERRRRSNS